MRYSDFVIILQIDSLYPALPGDEIKSAKLFIFLVIDCGIIVNKRLYLDRNNNLLEPRDLLNNI
jgi:hypothetical protein